MSGDRCPTCERPRVELCEKYGRPCRPAYKPRRRKRAGDTPQMKRCRAYWSKRYAEMVGA